MKRRSKKRKIKLNKTDNSPSSKNRIFKELINIQTKENVGK